MVVACHASVHFGLLEEVSLMVDCIDKGEAAVDMEVQLWIRVLLADVFVFL